MSAPRPAALGAQPPGCDANMQHSDFGSHYTGASCGWYYGTAHHLFYKYDNASQCLRAESLEEIPQ